MEHNRPVNACCSQCDSDVRRGVLLERLRVIQRVGEREVGNFSVSAANLETFLTRRRFPSAPTLLHLHPCNPPLPFLATACAVKTTHHKSWSASCARDFGQGPGNPSNLELDVQSRQIRFSPTRRPVVKFKKLGFYCPSFTVITTLSMSFPCATPRELQGVRRCAAAGRAGSLQLRTEGLHLEGTPDSGRLFKMSVSSSSTAPPASRAFCSSSSPAVAPHAPSSTAPQSADSPAGRSLDDGFRSPTAGSASSLRLLSSPARPQCKSVSLFAAVRRQEHKAMRSRHMAVIIGRQHPVLRRQLSSDLSWPAPFPAAMVVKKLSRTSRSLFMMTAMTYV